MIGRLQQRADFQRLLASRPCLRSAHFAVHYVHARPALPGKRAHRPSGENLSTECEPHRNEIVDNSPNGTWLGLSLPKRHARRAVTRSMLRRQIQAAARRNEHHMSPGLWLVRLRAPFDRVAMPSADSATLRAAAAGELDALLRRAG